MYDFEIEQDMKEVFNDLEDKICESDNELGEDYSEEYISGYMNGLNMAIELLNEYGYGANMKEQLYDNKTAINSNKNDFESKEYRELYNKLLELVDSCNDKELLMVAKFFVNRSAWTLTGDLEDKNIEEEHKKLTEIAYKLQKILENYV